MASCVSGCADVSCVAFGTPESLDMAGWLGLVETWEEPYRSVLVKDPSIDVLVEDSLRVELF